MKFNERVGNDECFHFLPLWIKIEKSVATKGCWKEHKLKQ